MKKSRWRDVDELVMWYESMSNVERLAVHAWINTGEKNLLRHLAHRVFVIRIGIIRAIELFTTKRLG